MYAKIYAILSTGYIQLRYIIFAITIILITVCAISPFSYAMAKEAITKQIAPFTVTSFATLHAKASADAPVIAMFWSLDCAHCSEGVALLKQVQGKAQIVSVATDDIAQQSDLAHHLQHHGNTFAAYAFADTPEKLRYSVDKKWRGETPVFYVLKPGRVPVKFLGLPALDALEQALK